MSTGEQVHPGPPNGLELSCRASRIRFRVNRFSAAGPVSCSELLGSPDWPVRSGAKSTYFRPAASIRRAQSLWNRRILETSSWDRGTQCARLFLAM